MCWYVNRIQVCPRSTVFVFLCCPLSFYYFDCFNKWKKNANKPYGLTITYFDGRLNFLFLFL